MRRIEIDRIVTATTVGGLDRQVSASGSYFFSRDTMGFFGTVDVSLRPPGVVVGTDLRAPEGYPRHWVRLFHTRDDGFVTSDDLGKFTERAAADRFAAFMAERIVSRGYCDLDD